MKDAHDNKTRDLLAPPATPGSTRQAAYAARMRAAGYSQRTFWLTAEESAAIDTLLKTIRATQSPELDHAD